MAFKIKDGIMIGATSIYNSSAQLVPGIATDSTLFTNLNANFLQGFTAGYFAPAASLSAYLLKNTAITSGTYTKITYDANGLIIGGTAATYDSLIADTVVSTVVGGAAAAPASTWKTKTIVQALDTILFPDQAPTYTIPVISLINSTSGLKEVGSSVSQGLTASFTKNDSGICTSLTLYRGASSLATVSNPTGTTASDIPAQFGYSDPNNPNFTYTLNITDTLTVAYGANSATWSGKAAYNAGVAKNNNKGVLDGRSAAVLSVNAPQAANSNFNTNTVAIEGAYPYFYGCSSSQQSAAQVVDLIQGGAGTKVLASGSGSGSLSMNFSASGQWIWFAIYDSIAAKTTWYETALNNGTIGGATDLIAAPTTLALNSPTSLWSGVNYKIYVAQKVTTIGTATIA
jgi:hypothetical protein